jgi:type II secretory pathway pseudopilin PulG
MNQFKKGAMFGLDARIALAIFGALSVISGAALYSAIQDSKITATVAQFEEFAKATDAYLLDTGLELPVYTPSPVFLLPNRLIENLDTVNGWNGPYWSRGYADAYDNTDILGRVGFLNYLGAGIVQAAKTDWGSYTTNDAIDTCTATDCHLWAYIEHHHSDDLSLAKGIEEKVDNTDNAAQGKVRVRKFATGYNLYYYIRPKTQ